MTRRLRNYLWAKERRDVSASSSLGVASASGGSLKKGIGGRKRREFRIINAISYGGNGRRRRWWRGGIFEQRLGLRYFNYTEIEVGRIRPGSSIVARGGIHAPFDIRSRGKNI